MVTRCPASCQCQLGPGNAQRRRVDCTRPAFGSYRDGWEIIRRAASKDKELVIIEGYSHYDLYDKPEPVSEVLAKLVPFFKKHVPSSCFGF